MDRNAWFALTALLAALLSPLPAAAGPEPAPASAGPAVYAAARQAVEASDRYLHHSRLRRGMTGYGLTVLAGTEIVRFDAEIVSVVDDWGPQRAVILARLSGQGLEKTGIIAGMSGSPVYVRDPRDGKDKMIGAVAYGWSLQKEPLCGIQPITQMLAVSKAYEGLEDAEAARSGGQGAADESIAGAAVATGPRGTRESLAALLDPRKRDFGEWLAGELGVPGRTDVSEAGPAGLEPLATPLMVSGLDESTRRLLQRRLAPLGLLPVRAGGGGAVA